MGLSSFVAAGASEDRVYGQSDGGGHEGAGEEAGEGEGRRDRRVSPGWRLLWGIPDPDPVVRALGLPAELGKVTTSMAQPKPARPGAWRHRGPNDTHTLPKSEKH